MNKVFLIGNLTKNPEIATTKNGIAVAKMTIAVNRNFAGANGEREVDFFNIIAWRALADNCGKYLSKGKKIALSGNLQNRSWTAEDGLKKYVTEVMAEDIEFLSPRQEGEDEKQEKKKAFKDLKQIEIDSLPF